MGINGPSRIDMPNPAEMAAAMENFDAKQKEQAAKEAGWDDARQAELMTELMNAQADIGATDKGLAKEIRAGLKAALAGETVDLDALRNRVNAYKETAIGQAKVEVNEKMWVPPEAVEQPEELELDEPTEETEEIEKNDLMEDQDYQTLENSLGALIAYGDVLNHVADKDLWDNEGNLQITPENDHERQIIDMLTQNSTETGISPQELAKSWLSEYEESADRSVRNLDNKKFTGDTSTLDSAKDDWNKYLQKRQVTKIAA